MGKLKSKSARLGYTANSIDTTPVTRKWKNVKVADLAVDDIIAHMGIVTYLQTTCDNQVYVEAGESTRDFFPAEFTVFAFVKKEGN